MSILSSWPRPATNTYYIHSLHTYSGHTKKLSLPFAFGELHVITNEGYLFGVKFFVLLTHCACCLSFGLESIRFMSNVSCFMFHISCATNINIIRKEMNVIGLSETCEAKGQHIGYGHLLIKTENFSSNYDG